MTYTHSTSVQAIPYWVINTWEAYSISYREEKPSWNRIEIIWFYDYWTLLNSTQLQAAANP